VIVAAAPQRKVHAPLGGINNCIFLPASKSLPLNLF